MSAVQRASAIRHSCTYAHRRDVLFELVELRTAAGLLC